MFMDTIAEIDKSYTHTTIIFSWKKNVKNCARYRLKSISRSYIFNSKTTPIQRVIQIKVGSCSDLLDPFKHAFSCQKYATNAFQS